MSLFFGPKLYVFNMRLKMPDGERKVVRITGIGFDDFAKEAFMAGVKFGQEHPELQEKVPE